MTKRTPLSFSQNKLSSLPPSQQASLSETGHANKIANDETRKHENMVDSKRAKAVPKQGRAGRHFVAAHILPEAVKQFKLLAVQSDKTTQELLVEAINDIFAKNGLSRIAD